MSNCNKINSIEKLSLERLIDQIWDCYRKEQYGSAVKLSQKGLVTASKANDILWVQMFDVLYKEMIEAYSKNISKNESEESNVKGHVAVSNNYQTLKIIL